MCGHLGLDQVFLAPVMTKLTALTLLIFLHLRSRILNNQLAVFQQESDKDLVALERVLVMAMNFELKEPLDGELVSQIFRVASMLLRARPLDLDESVISDMLWFAAQHNHTDFLRRVLEDPSLCHADIVQAYMECDMSPVVGRKGSFQSSVMLGVPGGGHKRRRSSCRRSFSEGPMGTPNSSPDWRLH